MVDKYLVYIGIAILALTVIGFNLMVVNYPLISIGILVGILITIKLKNKIRGK